MECACYAHCPDAEPPNVQLKELLDILRGLCEGAASRVLLGLCPGLPEELKTQLILEYDRGRNHIIMYLMMKFGCWGQLLLILLGISHYNAEKARARARKALQLFEAYGDAYDHHGVTMIPLVADLREQVVAFANGAALSALPGLQTWSARFSSCA